MTDKAAALEIVEKGAVHHLTVQRVSRKVSNSRNEGPECIEPAEHPELVEFGVAGYSDETLQLLRTQPAEEFITVHRLRMLEWESEDDKPALAEVHLWMREARERPDAALFAEFIEDCKRYVRRLFNRPAIRPKNTASRAFVLRIEPPGASRPFGLRSLSQKSALQPGLAQ